MPLHPRITSGVSQWLANRRDKVNHAVLGAPAGRAEMNIAIWVAILMGASVAVVLVLTAAKRRKDN
jgi:hypothetical protein